ncbi:MAG: non-ribosomal peptide synthetase, partial [Gemmatimonadetes bacterium]|nr:non-ribosomal peptide synthetase [Gemmatimonadota bacterium]
PREALEAGVLARAATVLEAHHDALRLRFRQAEDGSWKQVHAGVGEHAPLTVFDLSGIAEEEQGRVIEGTAAQVQRSLDLEQGPLLRMGYFDLGAGRPGRLLEVVHHLAMDGVSWRILLEDLESAYTQLSRGEAVQLPAKTTSWQAWAQRLGEEAGSERLAREASYWRGELGKAVAPLPVEGRRGENRVWQSRAVGVHLSEAETEALLREVPAVYRTQITEVLLCGLAAALRRWTGERRVRIELEGHGREEEIVGGVDLSRTVGWFTSQYPVVLELPESGGVGAALKAVKEQLRGVPHRGIGYGLLRYLSGSEVGEELAGEAEVGFNYLGQLDAAVSGEAFFGFAPESAGASVDGRSPRAHLLEVSGSVQGGRLVLQIGYAEGVHRHETVERLAQGYVEELRELIAHCTSAEAGGCTPSDFPLAGLEQTALDALLGSERGVEDVYPLTPLQEGMLFHALYAPGSGVYLGQAGFVLEGRLDAEALERAWQGTVARHEALRAGFAWEGVPRPLQVIRQEAKLAFHQEDWRGLDEAEQQARLELYLTADRAAGFDLRRGPLMRIGLFRLADEEHQLVWTHHHLVLDGWSFSMLFGDVLTLYRAYAHGEVPKVAPARRYREYVAWLERQDRTRAERHWREALAGFDSPTPLPIVRTRRSDTDAKEAEGLGVAKLLLAPERTAALQEQARKWGVTMSTLVQGAWALLLGRYAGEEDVLFGA